MAFLIQESTKFPRIQQNFAPLEHRPMLLKDFLKDDSSTHSCTASSSLSNKSTAAAVPSKSNKPHIVLLRDWSRRAAATKISAVHKVIKLLQFASSKSPLVLPRTISRKLTNKRAKDDDNDILVGVSEVKVKVKDILRWRSFRNTSEDDPRPLDFPLSPHRRTTAAATTTTTTTSCSKRSSWCDSDFTAEELPPWGVENEEFSTLKNPKGDWSSFEEYEQQSPVSVLDSPFRQVQEFTHVHPILENVQSVGIKWCLTPRTQERSTLKGEIAIYEEKARQLLSRVEEDEDDVMLDFFIDELSRNGKLNDDEFDCELLRIAKSWMDGEFGESYEWKVEEERDSFVKDMERGFCWNKFEEERQELCEEVEVGVLNCLIDDLVADLLC